MALGSGLAAQCGVVDEVTYGTPVVVTRFYEFTGEGPQMDIERMESAALRSGTRVQRSDRWVAGKRNVEGDLEFELANKSFGLLLKHMMGGVATAQPDAGGNPTVYKHTFTPGDLPVSFTTQMGRPDVGGTVRPFTYHGCRVSEWELSCTAGEIAKLKLSLIGEDEDTSTGLAVASYPSTLTLLTFMQGTLTIGGAATDVKDFSLSGNNGLADDRYFFGSALRKNPLEAAMREYTGDITSEFTSLTDYNRFVNGTEAALVLLFSAGTITGAFNYELKITANIRVDGETPTVSGPEIVEQPLSFKCVGNTPATALTIEYQTTDTTP
jgi:hypothetical protein